MVTDDQSPATKQDIRLLMDDIGKLYSANEHWKDQILEHMGNWKSEILDEMKNWKTEIIHEFHIVVEDLRHDYVGAHKDRIENHEDRIVHLEKHTGVVPR